MGTTHKYNSEHVSIDKKVFTEYINKTKCSEVAVVRHSAFTIDQLKSRKREAIVML